MSELPSLTVVKIGGHVIDDESALTQTLEYFKNLNGPKLLVHGGGKVATKMARELHIPQTMIEGRRVTDAETLRVITMVYGGLVNKTLVARLQAMGVSALGVTGADGNLILSRKRAATPIDYGFVGDIEKVNRERLDEWMATGLVPVVAPLTHDGQGQILNTNADSIATALAIALSEKFSVTLMFSFEKKGVLADVNDENSVIREITYDVFQRMKAEKKIFEGMIPKLDNAFRSIKSGVKTVVIGRAGEAGTRLSQ